LREELFIKIVRVALTMTDWKIFNEELATLINIPIPTIITTNYNFQKATEDLTSTLQDIIHTAVPTSKPCPHSKRWWT
jgi:hypothetical protein